MNAEFKRFIPPGHLGPAGAAFYEEVLSTYHVDDVVGRQLLIQAAEAVDRLAAARDLLARDGIVAYDGSGNLRVHPAVRIEKDANQTLRVALRQLRLDIEPPHLVGTLDREGRSHKSPLALKIRLLADLRELFGERRTMSTAEILAGLQAKENAPWGNSGGQPLTACELASMLREFGISSKKVKIAGRGLQGYRREFFESAWRRHLQKNFDAGGTSATARI